MERHKDHEYHGNAATDAPANANDKKEGVHPENNPAHGRRSRMRKRRTPQMITPASCTCHVMLTTQLAARTASERKRELRPTCDKPPTPTPLPNLLAPYPHKARCQLGAVHYYSSW